LVFGLFDIGRRPSDVGLRTPLVTSDSSTSDIGHRT